PNHVGSASGTLVIGPASATVTVGLGDLTQAYSGAPEFATATATGVGGSNLPVAVTYRQGGQAVTSPVNAGRYDVTAAVTDPDYSGSASGTLVINKATAAVALGNLTQTYDGSPKAAAATPSVTGLAVDVTYGGSAAAPTNAGAYAVVASVD